MYKPLPAACQLTFRAMPAHAPPNMTPGLREITMKSEIQGMPGAWACRQPP